MEQMGCYVMRLPLVQKFQKQRSQILERLVLTHLGG